MPGMSAAAVSANVFHMNLLWVANFWTSNNFRPPVDLETKTKLKLIRYCFVIRCNCSRSGKWKVQFGKRYVKFKKCKTNPSKKEKIYLWGYFKSVLQFEGKKYFVKFWESLALFYKEINFFCAAKVLFSWKKQFAVSKSNIYLIFFRSIL